MHIELTEMLRCPEDHEQQHLVLSTGEMKGRMVRSGILGCPVCKKEYRVLNGVVQFGESGEARSERRDAGGVDPATIQALLDLSGPGGIVALVGEAVRYAPALRELMEGVHFVGTNAPAECQESPTLSLLRAGSSIPLRDAQARGVMLGTDVACEPWLTDAQRILLRGRRWVVGLQSAQVPAGIKVLATGDGFVVGEKR